MLQELQNLALSFWTATPVKLWIIFVLIGLAVELFIRAEKNQPWRNIWFNIRYSAVYLAVIFVAAPTMNLVVNRISQALGAGWIDLDIFSGGYLQQIAAAALYFIIVDFFYYWYHRSQHSFGWLWQQHALHHSEESLNASTATRHHWLEFFFQIFVIVLPMTILFKLTPVSVWIISMVGAGWTWVIHLNARVHLGPLARVIVGPQGHRIHHSIEAQHQDKNFAAYFAFWDVLFGTYHHSARNEYPATGLASGEKILSVTEASVYPFRKWIEMFRARRASTEPSPS
ncbi:MAG: hypothetical protein JWL86_1009 [Rhizobium sp.]|nr:hypothetical protein [Rhizobium sp.]